MLHQRHLTLTQPPRPYPNKSKSTDCKTVSYTTSSKSSAASSTKVTPAQCSAIIPIREQNGLLIGEFLVGSGTTLALSIDTSFSNTFIVDGAYKGFWEDGAPEIWHYQSPMLSGTMCNMTDILYYPANGTMNIEGLTVHNQTFGFFYGQPSRNSDIIDHFPNDGVLGLGYWNMTFQSYGWSNPSLINNVYHQNNVQEWRFGLALSPDGNGSLIVGGSDMSMSKHAIEHRNSA